MSDKHVDLLVRSLGRTLRFTLTESGCWQWERGMHGFPYPLPAVWQDKRVRKLHRLIWDQLRAPTRGLIIRNECGNRRCCNPSHYAAVDAPRQGRYVAAPPRTHWFQTNSKGCWIWTGRCSSGNGYGNVMINGKPVLTHRRAYELTYGPIPAADFHRGGMLYILHRCDNPPCCNPEHLFAGTQADNFDDWSRKGRGNHLSMEDAEQIRALRASGMSYPKIAMRYNVCTKTLTRICRFESHTSEPKRYKGPLRRDETPVSGACWLWDGPRSRGGYGRFKLNGVMVSAHRRAWEVINGPIPTGMIVRHRCDTAHCINVGHLVLGTLQDNSDDRNVRLRGTHKLTWEQVAEVRRLRAEEKLTYKAIGRLFNIDPSSILRICRGDIYREVV